MTGNNPEIESDVDYENESLLLETNQALNEYKQELQNKNQYFEYKNRSKDGKFFVFSYNAVTGENISNIKQKYVDQYGGNKEGIIVTDENGHEISVQEFRHATKVYLKINRENNPHPIKFYNVSFSGNRKYVCFIDKYGWTPHNIRQMYQDQMDTAIPKENFLLFNQNNSPYDESFKFTPGDVINLQFKNLESDATSTSILKSNIEENHKGEVKKDLNGENLEYNTDGNSIYNLQELDEYSVESQEKVNRYKDMIEKQGIPLSHGNRANAEISLTFDDGYGDAYIRDILDALRGSGIKATFFILGECIKKSKTLWKQAIEDGHQICCHTYSHAYLSDGDTTQLFKGHGISQERRPSLIKSWEQNVKRLLGMDYYDDIKSKNPGIPEVINSETLLETEILMWEEEVRQSLGEAYLSEMKLNHPFFRFPGDCGSKRMENIDVLKKHGYLAIGWNGEPKYGIPKNVSNGDIPLFHFDKKNISALKPYISTMIQSGKSPKLISEIINP